MSRRSPTPLWHAAVGLAMAALWASGILGRWLAVPVPPDSLQRLVTGLALIGLVGLGLVWWIRRARRRRLLARAGSMADLHRLSWAQFEQLVGEAYRRHGWRVVETGQGGADGGIDLLMQRKGQRCMVQVKHWQARVGAPVVREMFGLMVHHRAQRVAVVALGGFTTEAVAFAQGKPIDLVDGPGLLTLAGGRIPEAVTAPAGRSRPAASAPPRKGAGAPKCPHCETRMVRRVRRDDGSVFWGCPNYPGCTGTRSIRS